MVNGLEPKPTLSRAEFHMHANLTSFIIADGVHSHEWSPQGHIPARGNLSYTRIRSMKGYSHWNQMLRYGWPARGKPRRTSGPFPYKLQPMKTAESDEFPSTLQSDGATKRPQESVSKQKGWPWGARGWTHTDCHHNQQGVDYIKTCNLLLITNYMPKNVTSSVIFHIT